MRYLGKDINKGIGSDLKFSKQSFQTFKIEKSEFFKERLPKSTRLQKTIEKYEEDYEQVRELTLDVFTAAFKYHPILLDTNEMQSDYLFNHFAISTLLKDAKYKELRSMTRHDELSSLMVTELFMDKVMKIINEAKDKLEESLKEYKKAQKEAKEAYKKAKESGEIEDEKSLEEAKKILEKSREKLKEAYDKNVKRKVKKILGGVLNDAKGLHDTISNWGLGSDDSYQKMPYEDKVNMIDNLKNNPKLKKIALLAGKLTELFLEGEKAKTTKTRSNIEDVVMGNDIPRVLTSELMKLRHPTLKRQFYKSYNERKLLQHEYGGRVKKGKGPIVSMIDSSGSMMGENEIYAKATCMALLDIAKRQKRSFMAIHFDSGTSARNLKVNKFSKSNPYKITEVIDMIEYFGGGGTEFEPPLERARIEINEEKEFSKADVIMITDGCSAVGDSFLEDFLEWKDKKNVTLFSVLMDRGYASTSSLDEFSDKVTRIENLQEEGMGVARNLFSTLL